LSTLSRPFVWRSECRRVAVSASTRQRSQVQLTRLPLLRPHVTALSFESQSESLKVLFWLDSEYSESWTIANVTIFCLCLSSDPHLVIKSHRGSRGPRSPLLVHDSNRTRYIPALCPYLRTPCTSFPFGDHLQNIRTTYWHSVRQMAIQISRIEYQGSPSALSDGTFFVPCV